MIAQLAWVVEVWDLGGQHLLVPESTLKNHVRFSGRGPGSGSCGNKLGQHLAKLSLLAEADIGEH